MNERRDAQQVAGGASERAAGAARAKRRAAGISTACSALLVVMKLVVGFATGTISVISDGLHSAVDLMAAAISYFSVRLSDSPPDADHPYGHGKIESISVLVEAILIFVGASFIVSHALEHLREPRGTPALHVNAGMVVMAISAVVALLLAAYLSRTSRLTDSPALAGDAAHVKTDLITSIGVFVGLALVRITGKSWVDAVAALAVACVIVLTGIRLVKSSLDLLIDTRLPPEEERAIQDILDSDHRVLGYHKLRTRKSGSQRHADVHVLIDDNYSLVKAHDLTEELEDRIRSVLPLILINIHTEPYHAEMRHQLEAHGTDLTRPSERAQTPAEPNTPEGSGSTKRT